MASFLLFLFLLGLFLFPIAVYCIILGMINRRPTPLIVSGSWDFVGLLFATSGFLFFVGPYVLSGGFRQSIRDLPIEHPAPNAREGITDVGEEVGKVFATWWAIWIVYYLATVCGATLLVWARRTVTVVYNIQPNVLTHVLGQTADRLGLQMARRGNRIYFDPAAPMPLESSEQVIPGSALRVQKVSAGPQRAPFVVELEPFPLMCNVSIQWRSVDPDTRVEFEREMSVILDQSVLLDSPVGGWLMAIGAFIFILIIVATAVIVLGATAGTRR